MASIKTIVRRAWGALGPGLTTGAADDDPSGIATYSQAGAQFGYALTWSMLLTLPFMAAIQLISPIMAAMMLAVSGKSHHRQLALPRWLQVLGWLATALMAVAVAAFAWTSI
jgi:Mn2+/Fe2+ NRAMP family transporter